MSDPTEPTADPAPRPGSPAGAGGIYSPRAKALIVVALVAALGLLVVAFQVAQTGVDDDPIATSGGPAGPPAGSDGAAPLDGFGLRPASGAESVLRQSEIGIDLLPGWDATLIVDGVEIPVDEQRRVPAENQVFFTPGEGKVVERLPGGPTCVTAIYWRLQDGRGANDRQLRWCFSTL